jgi:hypothetical protein
VNQYYFYVHDRDWGHQVNRKLLEVERVSHHCVLTQEAIDRLQQPNIEAGQRGPWPRPRS